MPNACSVEGQLVYAAHSRNFYSTSGAQRMPLQQCAALCLMNCLTVGGVSRNSPSTRARRLCHIRHILFSHHSLQRWGRKGHSPLGSVAHPSNVIERSSSLFRQSGANQREHRQQYVTQDQTDWFLCISFFSRTKMERFERLNPPPNGLSNSLLKKLTSFFHAGNLCSGYNRVSGHAAAVGFV